MCLFCYLCRILRNRILRNSMKPLHLEYYLYQCNQILLDCCFMLPPLPYGIEWLAKQLIIFIYVSTFSSAGCRVSLVEQAWGRRLRPKSFYIVERAKSGVKKNMQLKHLACVLAKDLLILMEAYCLCCNSLVLDVRLVRTKANLYIPSDLCFRSLWYRTHIFIPCGFNPGQEWMFTRIKWHSWFHLFLGRMQNRPGINPVVPNEALAGPGVAMFRNKDARTWHVMTLITF